MTTSIKSIQQVRSRFQIYIMILSWFNMNENQDNKSLILYSTIISPQITAVNNLCVIQMEDQSI